MQTAIARRQYVTEVVHISWPRGEQDPYNPERSFEPWMRERSTCCTP